MKSQYLNTMNIVHNDSDRTEHHPYEEMKNRYLNASGNQPEEMKNHYLER